MAQERKIPFEIQASKEITRDSGRQAFLAPRAKAKKNGVQDLTLEEMPAHSPPGFQFPSGRALPYSSYMHLGINSYICRFSAYRNEITSLGAVSRYACS